MAQLRRTPASRTSKRDMGAGVYLARIVSALDPTFMGNLEVTLLRDQGNKIGDAGQTYIVKCASPFFGSTAYEFTGLNTASPSLSESISGAKKSTTDEAYNDTQKSYGMWFVPPDVGITVLVVFVNGDPTEGYWIGCVPSRFANHMVPGIASSTKVDISPEDKKKFNNAERLPVAEINKKLNSAEEKRIDADSVKKAVHPIANRFLEQGLLEDDIRGITTSTARREVPSAVFGISTPGPVDRRQNSKRASIGKIQGPSPRTVPVSRLGGTTLVFDDGDDRFQRLKSAGELGKGDAYVDILQGKSGDPTIPYSEYFRVRTRTGHQILLHNSEDLIYIGNAKGTAWVELTSNGKIDIFSKDSISIHTEQDLNIRADRDINLEAGRNINMKAANDNPLYPKGGRIRQEAATDWEVLVGRDGKITVANNFNIYVGDKEKNTGGDTKITTLVGNFDLRTNGNNKFTALSGNTDIKSGGNHTETAAIIHMNGPTAKGAAVAEPIKPISIYQNPKTDPSVGWDKKYQAGTIDSIMKRVPMHEPWILHENLAPDILKPENTDRGE